MTHRIYQMTFPSVYKALVAKVERKGGSEADVDAITSWLTGYSLEQLAELKQSETTYGDFINQGPAYHPARTNITGKICDVQIETIEDPTMQELRRLDKLVDWLAKGKTVEQVIDKYAKD
ncbi:hypothetical protein J2T50_001324 [Streptococcus gallinaceus]|uniref:DUF2200 domain-containing protein n=1 Tax=Streptococcus gallinaceus TaxID=165758 RepID=UPI00209ED7D7|nr:DUF2200 domain-containing protein [Streptococcus gallinaceus]MCP1639624.1 hypothetical protein [Streptococcus gallinaceus]MCP1770407.1 hypothetical protein [Streptococcus gallinaceus]